MAHPFHIHQCQKRESSKILNVNGETSFFKDYAFVVVIVASATMLYTPPSSVSILRQVLVCHPVRIKKKQNTPQSRNSFKIQSQNGR